MTTTTSEELLKKIMEINEINARRYLSLRELIVFGANYSNDPIYESFFDKTIKDITTRVDAIKDNVKIDGAMIDDIVDSVIQSYTTYSNSIKHAGR